MWFRFRIFSASGSGSAIDLQNRDAEPEPDFSYIFHIFPQSNLNPQIFSIYTQKCQNLRMKGFDSRNLLIMSYALPRQHAWPCLLILKLQYRSRDHLP